MFVLMVEIFLKMYRITSPSFSISVLKPKGAYLFFSTFPFGVLTSMVLSSYFAIKFAIKLTGWDFKKSHLNY